MKGMVRSGIAALALLAVIGAPREARGELHPGQLMIFNAVPNLVAQQLVITGQNFGTRPQLIALNGSALTFSVYTNTVIVADLPASVIASPGTYTLMVTRSGPFLTLLLRTWVTDVSIGSVGPEGPQGKAGPQGEIGPMGPPGEQGPQGAVGPTGATGAQGPQGPIGPTGATGPQGPQGTQGAQGPPGSANINGTSNFLIKFTSPTTGGNSLLFDNGFGVGIGTVAPAFPFQLLGANGSRNLDIQNSNANGDAIWGINTAAAGSGTAAGVVGTTSQASAQGAGVLGQNTNANGTGVIGLGNNSGSSVLPEGSGGAFTGFTTGVYARSTTAGVGEAILGDQFGDIVRVAYWNGTSFYKIHGTGTVSTNVKDPTDPAGQRKISLHAPETPEIYFMDFGTGQLQNGRAHIELDARLTGNVAIDTTHPMRVFIQLEENEDTRGVVVKNKTATGFDVVEISGGQSSQPFQWQVVLNRADEVLSDGKVSYNADARFEPAPDGTASPR